MATVNMAAISMLLLTYVAVSMVSACVPPSCVYREQRREDEWDLDNPWLIAIIALSCIFFLAILIILLWFCCYCCYRDNVSMAPRVVRRIIRVKHPAEPKVVCEPPPRRVLHLITPPPPPPPPPQQDKIIVVPAACPEPPQSLLLTVTEGLHAGSNGPDMSTRVDKPLTFTLTPQPTGVRQSGLRVHDHMPPISGQVDCNYYDRGCCD